MPEPEEDEDYIDFDDFDDEDEKGSAFGSLFGGKKEKSSILNAAPVFSA